MLQRSVESNKLEREQEKEIVERDISEMVRAACCSKMGILRGQWTSREDELLTSYIHSHGEGNWRSLPKKAGLLRCGKSCRLRWVNYLRPDIKRGNISPEEEDLIIRLHSLLGNRWSLIAGRLPGRTDNEIKNYWNSQLSKKLKKPGLLLREEGSSPRRGPKRSGDRSSDHLLRSSSSSNTDNNSHSKAGDHEIYAPKAIRLAPSSRFVVRNCNTTSSVTEHNSKEEEAAVAAGSGDPTCSGYSDEGILTSPPSDGAAGGDSQIFESFNYLGMDFDLDSANCDLHLHDHAVFDSLFHEYSQLLQSDHMDPGLQFMDPFSDSVPMLQY